MGDEQKDFEIHLLLKITRKDRAVGMDLGPTSLRLTTNPGFLPGHYLSCVRDAGVTFTDED